MISSRVDPNGSCFCGCGASVRPGVFFKTGHDKKAESELNAIEHGSSIVERLVAAGYGPGGINLHDHAIELGLREECSIDGCHVSGPPGGVALRRHRQTQHPFRKKGRQTVDPAFASAVERRYLAELRKRVGKLGSDFGTDMDSGAAGVILDALHRDILDTAIYKSAGDGGLRFKVLADKDAFEARLFEALKKALHQ